MGTAIFTDAQDQSTPVRRHLPTLPKSVQSRPNVTHSQEIPHHLTPNAFSKVVTLQEAPSHKDSSDQFRRHSRNFESGEFFTAMQSSKEPEESSSSDSESISSTTEEEHRVRFMEVPGYGESSPEFRRKSHEFDRNEFAHVKESPFVRFKKQRSKTAVTGGEKTQSSQKPRSKDLV